MSENDDKEICDSYNELLEVVKVNSQNIKLEPSETTNVDFNEYDESLFYDSILVMGKLLENLTCSFYNRQGEVVVSGLSEEEVESLLERMNMSHVAVARVECCVDGIFGVVVDDLRLGDAASGHSPQSRQFTDEMFRLAKRLLKLAAGTGASLTTNIRDGSILLCGMACDELHGFMNKLRNEGLRPHRVEARGSDGFSLVFGGSNSTGATGAMSMKVNDRKRLSPGYLRDFVELEDVESNPRRVTTPLAAANGVKKGRGRPRTKPIIAKQPMFDSEGNVVVRGRGRPRLKPLLGDNDRPWSSMEQKHAARYSLPVTLQAPPLRQDGPKKSRGRPRLSEKAPSNLRSNEISSPSNGFTGSFESIAEPLEAVDPYPCITSQIWTPATENIYTILCSYLFLSEDQK